MTDQHRETVQDIATALAALQASLPEVSKGETAEVQTKSGGKYSYTYADLAAVTEAIMPKLAEFGLSFSAKPTLIADSQFVLEYTLRHIGGDTDEGMYPLPSPLAVDERGRPLYTPQEIGSAITYARRYTLTAVTGLAPKGDDSDAAPITAAVRSQQAERPQEAPPGPSVDDQITQWMVRLDWNKAQVYDAYSRWNGGALLNEADVTARATFVTQMAEHHLKATAPAAVTAPKANVPADAHVAGGPYPDGDYIAQIQGLQASIGWDGDVLRAAYSKWNGGRTLAEADPGGLHEFVKQLRHELERVQRGTDETWTGPTGQPVPPPPASDEPPF